MVPQKLVVLLVEDNAVYALWLEKILHKECVEDGRKLTVSSVRSLFDAQQVADTKSIDAILLDLNLPDSQGLETVSAMIARHPKIPIIVISSIHDETLALRAVGIGAQDYLFKGMEYEGTVFRTIRRSIERKLTELELDKVKQAAIHNERMAAVGTLASGIAHEYNNICSVILGNVELVLRYPDLASGARDRLGRVLEAVDRGRAITGSLLDFVRGFHASPKVVILQEVITNTLRLVDATLITSTIELVVDMPKEPVFTSGNGSELGQVLLNLIINACHAMVDTPRKTLTISLCVALDGNGSTLEVQDSGTGIQPEDLPRIFLPFFSTKGEHGPTGLGNSTVRGTGLGLAVCDTFIRQHQGIIRVESQLGEGTLFQIWLPAAKTFAVDQPQAIAPTLLDVKVEALVGRRVLVIDDDQHVCELTTALLQDEGAVVQRAMNGEQALAIIRQGIEFDLILLDWLMSVMGGTEFLARHAELRGDNPPMILVLSGYLSASVEARLRRDSIPMLLKPINPVALIMQVKLMLGMRDERKHVKAQSDM